MADCFKHAVEECGGHNVDQFIIQTANGVASFPPPFDPPEAVQSDPQFPPGYPGNAVLCPGGTAGDELECVKVVVEKSPSSRRLPCPAPPGAFEAAPPNSCQAVC